MANPRRNDYDARYQTGNGTNNYQPGNTYIGQNGSTGYGSALGASGRTPAATSTARAPASSSIASQTMDTRTPYAMRADGAADVWRANVAQNNSQSGEIGIPMWEPNNEKGSVILKQEDERKGSGRGGSVKPSLPAEMAQQIADAYARSQAQGPAAWQNTYAPQIEGMRGQRYGDYESRYIPQIDRLTDRLLNRDPFRYNWSDDPLYRQYAARYQQAARQGMQDTMGQAQAMTGGYGNSYATAAANQAYQNQMAGLNDAAMDLYQMAADRYDQEGQEMRSNLAALEQREAANRGMYDTDRSVWYSRQDADLNNLLQQQAMDYQIYQDELARDQLERQLAWQQYAYWNDLYHQYYNYG